MRKIVYVLLCISGIYSMASAQKELIATELSEEIVVDGVLEEDFWDNATESGDFHQYFPDFASKATAQTSLKMGYDAENLYVGITCYGNGNWTVNSLKRDFRANGNDNITLVFDTFNDGTNAVFFGINAFGVNREGTISGGGAGVRGFDESWDNKWVGETATYDDRFTAELKIPFSSIRFAKDSQSWGLGSYRFDVTTNEWSTWTDIPPERTQFGLSHIGKLTFETPLPDPGKNISVIPFVTAGISKDYDADTPTKSIYDVGGDIKLGITSGLNLDLTFNPDFSQVEVDRQVTNIDRFEIFFPERRQFFLENADLFGSFGFSAINPFFSRRIGATSDNNGDLVQNRIFAGARLSGKLNESWRIGMLNMHTATDESKGVYGANFTVLALQKKILSRSNIGLIGVNKNLTTMSIPERDLNDYNRMFGVDFNYASDDNTWSGKSFLHYSFSPGIQTTPLAHGLEMNYSKRKYNLGWSHEYVGSGYEAEVGFIRRKDYYSMSPSAGLSFYPKDSYWSRLDVRLSTELLYRPNIGRTDHEHSLNLDGQTRTSDRFRVGITNNYVLLTSGFDPTGTGSEELEGDTDYNYTALEGFWFGNRARTLAYSFRGYLGQYFNGNRIGLGGTLTYTIKPVGAISVDYFWNRFDMPHLDEIKQTFLVGPRIDYTLNKKTFFTTFIQYNSQNQFTNINARFQYRFAPVSDFFLVFTDNYFTGYDPEDRFRVDVKNRAVVAKLTYWLNT